ncbi:hypothetical protein ACOME3_000583 [Neoechinorhynchus agilis]
MGNKFSKCKKQSVLDYKDAVPGLIGLEKIKTLNMTGMSTSSEHNTSGNMKGQQNRKIQKSKWFFSLKRDAKIATSVDEANSAVTKVTEKIEPNVVLNPKNFHIVGGKFLLIPKESNASAEWIEVDGTLSDLVLKCNKQLDSLWNVVKLRKRPNQASDVTTDESNDRKKMDKKQERNDEKGTQISVQVSPITEINNLINSNLALKFSEDSLNVGYVRDLSLSSISSDDSSDKKSSVTSITVDSLNNDLNNEIKLKEFKTLNSSSESIEVDDALINLVKSCNRELGEFYAAEKERAITTIDDSSDENSDDMDCLLPSKEFNSSSKLTDFGDSQINVLETNKNQSEELCVEETVQLASKNKKNVVDTDTKKHLDPENVVDTEKTDKVTS